MKNFSIEKEEKARKTCKIEDRREEKKSKEIVC
jgi:hypothetical protein